jgi:hypothetical protein
MVRSPGFTVAEQMAQANMALPSPKRNGDPKAAVPLHAFFCCASRDQDAEMSGIRSTWPG